MTKQQARELVNDVQAAWNAHVEADAAYTDRYNIDQSRKAHETYMRYKLLSNCLAVSKSNFPHLFAPSSAT